MLLAVGCSKKGSEPIAVLNSIPEFQLVDHEGESFGRDSLEGHLTVADFVFTHCRSSCPRLTAHMRGLQERLSDVPEASFLSVTVDPDNDTTEVLGAYVEKNGIKDDNWRFVTGEEQAIREVVLRGFRVGMDDKASEAQGGEEISHSNHFVLVDRNARVRGYYRADNDGIERLEKDLRSLASEAVAHH
jgi:protein SCO1/2